jgi:hypothetical protein
MRATLVFLLCAVPSTALLVWLDREDEGRARLPEEGPPSDAAPLLTGEDLADPYGQSPFSGAVRRLDGFELRVVEEGYFKLFLQVGRLGRAEGKPRLEDVQVLVFDPPKEGKPNRRFRLHAPYVRGDPRDLLHAPEAAPRIVTLDGGVKAYDAGGRLLAEAERLSLDATRKTVATDVPVILRLPERAAEVRAQGLDGDMGLRTVRLGGPVAASFAHPRGTVTLRAKGVATVEETEDGAQILVSVEGDVEIEQAAGRATCARAAAVFVREEGGMAFLRATLSGGVRLEFAPDAARGIESVEMPVVAIEGQERIVCEGPVRATWRGDLPRAVAIGRRSVRIDADSASFRLGRAEDGATLLEEARFEAFRAEDESGAGSLAGRSLGYLRADNRLVVEGAVEVKTASGSLAADRLTVAAPSPDDAYDLVVEGKKRIVYRGEAGLGAAGPGFGTELHIVSTGPLRLAARGEDITCDGEGDVVAATDTGASLRADRIRLALAKNRLVSFRAAGNVAASEPRRGAEIRGATLDYDGKVATVAGEGASVATKDGRSVRAASIAWRDDDTFAASGKVEVETTLQDGARWRLSCGDLRGRIAADGTPAAVEASGSVRATGPAGEEILGDSLAYDGAKGVATLLGTPARARRGEEVALVAPEGLTLRIAEGKVVEGKSLGPSTIDYRPAAPEGEKAKDFTRWVAELRGPARFESDRLVVDSGAKLTGHDGERVAIVAEAKRVEILLEAADRSYKAKRIAGSGGVRVEGRGKEPAVVTADRLSYLPGSREVRVEGDALVVAAGWPRDVRFRELVFSLTKDGIDLKSASDVEVR